MNCSIKTFSSSLTHWTLLPPVRVVSRLGVGKTRADCAYSVHCSIGFCVNGQWSVAVSIYSDIPVIVGMCKLETNQFRTHVCIRPLLGGYLPLPSVELCHKRTAETPGELSWTCHCDDYYFIKKWSTYFYSIVMDFIVVDC